MSEVRIKKKMRNLLWLTYGFTTIFAFQPGSRVNRDFTHEPLNCKRDIRDILTEQGLDLKDIIKLQQKFAKLDTSPQIEKSSDLLETSRLNAEKSRAIKEQKRKMKESLEPNFKPVTRKKPAELVHLRNKKKANLNTALPKKEKRIESKVKPFDQSKEESYPKFFHDNVIDKMDASIHDRKSTEALQYNEKRYPVLKGKEYDRSNRNSVILNDLDRDSQLSSSYSSEQRTSSIKISSTAHDRKSTETSQHIEKSDPVLRVREIENDKSSRNSVVLNELDSDSQLSSYSSEKRTRSMKTSSAAGGSSEVNKLRIDLTGVSLAQMVEGLVDSIGFEEMYKNTKIKCFMIKPTIASSLKALRQPQMEWARKAVEHLYIIEMKRKVSNLP